MKSLLVCVATAMALCVPPVYLSADEDDSAGSVRLTQGSAPPPPIPHEIGSDENSGQASLRGGNPSYSNLPAQPEMYSEYVGQGGGVGYRMANSPFTVQYRLNRTFGGLYGYDDGFTDIGIFVPRAIDEDSLIFTDLRGFVTDNEDFGFNLGGGVRHYNSYHDRVWSHALWLDYDGGHVEQYLRGGYSGSMTSRYWRYRWNGYYILGDQSNFIGTQLADSASFGGNAIQLARTRTREVAFSGVDATVGGPIPLLGRYGLNWDFGLYYNTAEHGESAVGFLASADAQVTEDISVGVTYSDDKIFGSNAQMNLAINLPDGRPSRIMRQPRVHDYMLRSDDRNYRVATQRYLVNDTVNLLNECDVPYNVAHIAPGDTDTGATLGGDGSFENPFVSTAAWEALSPAEKAAYDIVLVSPGNSPMGETYQNNLNDGITIVQNQRLLASTGRLVREVDSNNNEVYMWAAHMVSGGVEGYGSGVTYAIPGTDTLAGTAFDPVNDPRPVLSNHALVGLPDAPHAVVTIDNNFSTACDAYLTEVSGFVIDGYNPNQPTMYNNGIVSGNFADPDAARAITGFNINSNFIQDTIHGIHLVHEGNALGILEMNRIEGNGFDSNSGMNVYHLDGTLGLRVADNLVYNVFGEDIDNDGQSDVITTMNGSEDVNNNFKLDIGEDLDADGNIDINEDNDKDGVLSEDDHGIGFNFVATGPGAIIDAAQPGLGLEITRNVTHLDEAEYFRTQVLDGNGNVTNSFTAQDINGDVQVVGQTILDVSDTDDNIGNRNGMNLEARGGAQFFGSVTDNDTSFNNPYADGLLPPSKNPKLSITPVPLGDEYGFRAMATGAGSQMVLFSPDRHLSNSNLGHGATLEARDNAELIMLNPMAGAYTINPVTGNLGTVTPSEYNDNGLNGLRIYGDDNSSLAIQIGALDSVLDHTVANPADQTSRTYYSSNQFLRNGQDGDAATSGNGIEIYLRNGATLAANSGIFHAEITDNADSGVLIDVADTTFNNFAIFDSYISGNIADGIHFSAENAPSTNFYVVDNAINNNGRNGMDFQLESSTLTTPVIEGNLINGNGNLMAVNPVSQFNIDVVFQGNYSAAQQALIQQAAERIEQLIVGDLPDVMFNGEMIDDIQMLVTMDSLGDGILGFAAPTQLRNGTFLPFQGALTMNTDYADDEALFMETAIHEMMHALGFGTIWNDLNLLENPSLPNNQGADTRFTGAIATFEYNQLFGVTENGVPVENQAGPGSGDSHWRESVFNAEMMTPEAEAGNIREPISRITTASFQDLGYVVNLAASDIYVVPGSSTTVNHTASRGPTDPNPVVGYANALPVTSNRVVIDGTAQGNGINISANNSNLEYVLIENNLINGNTGDGVRIQNPQFASNGAGVNEVVFSLNQINNNVGHGINIALDNTNRLDTVICVNNISGNGMGGINVELSGNAHYDNGTFEHPDFANGNSFSGNTINNNGGIGYHITTDDDAEFELIGSSPLASTLNGNVEAGIGIEMNGNSSGTLELDNIAANNNVASTDPDATFSGDGIGIILNDSSQLNDMRLGDISITNPRPTTFNSNAGHGIFVEVNADATWIDPIISNVNANGNGIDNLHIERNGSGTIDNVFITASTFNNATGDGIEIISRNADSNDEFTIEDSMISGNGGRGIHVRAEDDAEIVLDLARNLISENASHGIHLTTFANSADINIDTRVITGTWVSNEITDNGGNGVYVAGTHGRLDGAIVPLQIGQNGTDGDGNSLGNLISGNEMNGIAFESAGWANVVNNLILDNAESGIDVIANNFEVISITDNVINENGLHGVNLVANNGTSIDANLARNLIRFNERDGVQVLANSGDQNSSGSANVGASVNLAMNGDDVLDNGGRGIDILSRGGGSSVTATIDDVYVSRNNEQGIYGVVTSSTTQDNENSAGDALAQDGSVFNRSYLNLSIFDSLVTNNSNGGNYDGGGVVLRVGTSGAAYTGGNSNNSTWQNPGSVNPDTHGGLVLSMVDTEIRNNSGVDLWMHTFTSTVDPATTTGGWTDQNTAVRDNSNDIFDPTGYQQDPLARIRIEQFSNITGGSADVFGASQAGGTSSNQNFAWYNNDESVFKSRTQNQDNATDGGPLDDNGPFNSGTRRRNATRLPARVTHITGTDLPPGLNINDDGAVSDNFLYPGVGESTLQINSAIGIGDLTLSGFDTVVTDFTDQIAIGNNGGISELDTSYYWETYP